MHGIGIPAFRRGFYQGGINHFFFIGRCADIRNSKGKHLISICRVTVLTNPVQGSIDY